MAMSSEPPSATSPPVLSREQIRSRRKREVRARTVNVTRLPKHVIDLGRVMYPEAVEGRPAVRRECAGGYRPCPFVGCKHHLFLDVNPSNGSLKMNFPDLEPWELDETCSLDVGDSGGETLEVVGALMNITRERVRKLEVRALARMARRGVELREYADEGLRGRRWLPVLGESGDE